ncbi:MAG: hypothetical protein AAFU73_21940 [Planctomycetota bacterium]
MIAYPIRPDQLRALIQSHDSDWLAAAARGEGPDWGRIKAVFFDLQQHKCGYCERRLPERGRVEQDIEHFRPKRRVTSSPGGPGSGRSGGYGRLAYNPDNFLVACKTCNTSLKKTQFPIDGRPGRDVDDVPVLDGVERPLLINPVGPKCGSPRRVICFEGILARPRTKGGRARRQADAIIGIFELNSREELLLGRFAVIWLTWLLFERRERQRGAEAKEARTDLNRLKRGWSEHTACIRDYIDLCEADPVRAWEYFDCARRVVGFSN